MPIIAIENMVKTYRSKALKFTALRGVSLDIEEGEFVMLMGPSGCGKTTLLNIIGCMDTFDEGRYTFGGDDIAAMDSAGLSRFRANNIGYVFQAYNLVDELNCADNVELTMGYAGVKKAERRKRANDLLRRMGLADKRKNYPSQLSGGQQQRVAIARALSNSPKLILADEPTGNLDQDTGLDIMNLLAELNRGGTTVLMATHNPEMSSFASRVVRMRDGKINE